MADEQPKVYFDPKRSRKNDWQLRVMAPDAALEYVTGFKSRADAERWRAGSECQNWLKERGYR